MWSSGASRRALICAVAVSYTVGTSCTQPPVAATAITSMRLQVMSHRSEKGGRPAVRQHETRGEPHLRQSDRPSERECAELRMRAGHLKRVVELECHHRRARAESDTDVRARQRIELAFVTTKEPVDSCVELDESEATRCRQTRTRTKGERCRDRDRGVGRAL